MENELVKDIRNYKGMTQKQFADWLGVHESTIANVETRFRLVSSQLANKIALKFNVADEDFIAYRERKRQAHDYFFNH